jgi:hypothetical protein
MFGWSNIGTSPRSLRRVLKRSLHRVGWATPILLATSVAFGNIIINPPASHIHSLTIPTDDDVVTLDPDPVTYLPSATAAVRLAMLAQFLFFNVHVSNQPLSGTLNITIYDAIAVGPHNGGARMFATYTPGSLHGPSPRQLRVHPTRRYE